MGSATTADLVDQSAPAENTSPSSRERPSPQTAQATSPAAAAGSPDLRAVTRASVAEPNAAASDARADFLRPTLDARTRDGAEGPARGGPSTASTTGTAISLTGTLVQMFLIVAAGLGVASLLYRVVTAATRRRQNSIDHLEADGIGDQNARDNQQQYRSVDERDQFVDDLHSSTIAAANDRDNQQQHRSVDDRDRLIEDLHRSRISGANDRDDPQHHRSVDDRNPFIDDLHRSLISGANDYDARRPHPDDDWPNNTRRAGGACHITDDVSKREDTLAQLRRDLDRLLQPNSREDQQQHGSSAKPEQFIDDLQRAPIWAQTTMDRAKMIMKAVAQPMRRGRTTRATPTAHPRLPTRSASATTGCRNCGGISIRCYNRQKARNSIHGECPRYSSRPAG